MRRRAACATTHSRKSTPSTTYSSFPQNAKGGLIFGPAQPIDLKRRKAKRANLARKKKRLLLREDNYGLTPPGASLSYLILMMTKSINSCLLVIRTLSSRHAVHLPVKIHSNHQLRHSALVQGISPPHQVRVRTIFLCQVLSHLLRILPKNHLQLITMEALIWMVMNRRLSCLTCLTRFQSWEILQLMKMI